MNFLSSTQPIVLVRGGGDLASGVVLRLRRVGFKVLVTELNAPLVVRRQASFAQAVFDGKAKVEEVEAELVTEAEDVLRVMEEGKVAVMVDAQAAIREKISPYAIVDGRMTKKAPDLNMKAAPLVIGLGPGFVAGENCHAVIETNRGPFLGRVYWQGSAEADSGIPETVRGFTVERVLYAPTGGVLRANAEIGEILETGAPIAEIDGQMVNAKFKGVLRGLIHDGLKVEKGVKIGDLDPRCDVRLCNLASDKSLSIGGGVLEALMMGRSRGTSS